MSGEKAMIQRECVVNISGEFEFMDSLFQIPEDNGDYEVHNSSKEMENYDNYSSMDTVVAVMDISENKFSFLNESGKVIEGIELKGEL